MIARVLKNTIRKQLREEMKQLGVPSEEPALAIIVSKLNQAAAIDRPASERAFFWREMKGELLLKFIRALSDEERAPQFDLTTLFRCVSPMRRRCILTTLPSSESTM